MRFVAKHQKLLLNAISVIVIFNGLQIIATTLWAQLHLHSAARLNDAIISLPLVSGMTLVYLGTLLNRRKQAAWAVIVPLYTFLLGFNITQYFNVEKTHQPAFIIRSIIIPLAIVTALIAFRKVFTVKSAIQSFSLSFQTIILLFIITFAYGTIGYSLLDSHDFHREISLTTAMHHTIDQFDFTTDEALQPQTKRATVFIDTLNILTAVTVGYAIIALFGPFRSKFTQQQRHREAVETLLKNNSDDSDDFFKLWPHDKNYYFETTNHQPVAAIAYRVVKGVALVVSEPIAKPKNREMLLNTFLDSCAVNDWLPAFIHISDRHRQDYLNKGFQLQKIGQEAIISVPHFLETVAPGKYFRQISNRFTKNGYTAEVLQPPHSTDLINRLRDVSDEWLQMPGRQERGFMMGYFNSDYLQQCNIIVARDSAGTIQAFLNQIPTYRTDEANFDMLRHSSKALGNINDYLMMAFIDAVHKQGYQTLNMGLCPLAGLDKHSENSNMIDSTLRFVYANGNRFYSFSGLERFKAKYEPTWSDRYIAYRGGFRGFTRSVYALNKAMNHTP